MTRLVLVAAVSIAFLLSPRALRAQDDKEAQRLKERIELLEAKLELLKKENELLKKEIELLKKGGAGEKPDPAKKDEVLKTTADGVDYEILSSKMNGKAWELTIAATSKEGEKKVLFEKFRAFTDDGKVIDIRSGLMKEPLTLPEGATVQTTITLNGPLANSKKVTQIELHQNDKAKKDSVVFKNVPLAR
jgi:cell division protein FtsB